MTRSIFVIGLLLLQQTGSSRAQDSTMSAAQAKYEGVIACKPCHLTAKSGAQYKVWEKGPHARAYETLSTSKAREIAAHKGIEQPQNAPECLRCHVTGYGASEHSKGPKLTLEEGVSCEACHGPGSAYRGRKLMSDIYEGVLDGAQFGLVPQSEKVCVACHNEQSPTYSGFDYDSMVLKIAHPVKLQSNKQ